MLLPLSWPLKCDCLRSNVDFVARGPAKSVNYRKKLQALSIKFLRVMRMKTGRSVGFEPTTLGYENPYSAKLN